MTKKSQHTIPMHVGGEPIVWRKTAKKLLGKGDGDREYSITYRSIGSRKIGPLYMYEYVQVNGVGPVGSTAPSIEEAKERCQQLQIEWSLKQRRGERGRAASAPAMQRKKAAEKPVHPSLKVLMCLCGHTKSEHRGAWGEPHAGACKRCVCEQFELEVPDANGGVTTATEAPSGAVSAPPFVWQKEWSKKAHPAAALFPMLGEKELAELAADIKANHQKEPITLTSDDLVLDGRNRLAACNLAGVEPEFVYWLEEEDGASPTAWVLSKNRHRRHLTPDQVSMVAAKALHLFEAEARARMRSGKKDPSATGAPGSGKAAAAAAMAIGGTTTRKVERAKWLAKSDPVRAEKVADGTLTLKRAEREIKHAEQVAQVKAYVPPTGEYGIVAFDYPWKFHDERTGSEKSRSGADYPKMTLEEICAFPLPVAKDCLLACWIPNALLIDGTWERIRLSLFERYGAVPKQMRTWTKTGAEGGDVTGLGKAFRNDTEQLILLERGTVTYVETGAEHEVPILRTSFDAPRGRESEKPALAYEQLAAICPMRPCIDVFARDPRPGWVTSGAELPAEKPTIENRHSGHPSWTEKVTAGEGPTPAPWKPDTCQAVQHPGHLHCALSPGHEGPHDNGRSRPWSDPPPPPTPEPVEQPRVMQRAGELIAWQPKKHPLKVAIGTAARTGRKYAIDKESKVGTHGKKIDAYSYRWFCTTDGASSLHNFDTIEQAQAFASTAEEEYQAHKFGPEKFAEVFKEKPPKPRKFTPIEEKPERRP